MNSKPITTTPTIEAIAGIVADYFQVSIDDLRGPGRPEQLTHARWCAISLAAEHTDISHSEIAEWFNRTPEAINNAIRKHREEREWNAPRRRKYLELQARLDSVCLMENWTSPKGKAKVRSCGFKSHCAIHLGLQTNEHCRVS